MAHRLRALATASMQGSMWIFLSQCSFFCLMLVTIFSGVIFFFSQERGCMMKEEEKKHKIRSEIISMRCNLYVTQG